VKSSKKKKRRKDQKNERQSDMNKRIDNARQEVEGRRVALWEKKKKESVKGLPNDRGSEKGEELKVQRGRRN
jgi:hypothetical protein